MTTAGRRVTARLADARKDLALAQAFFDSTQVFEGKTLMRFNVYIQTMRRIKR
jgi:hypothetical protein